MSKNTTDSFCDFLKVKKEADMYFDVAVAGGGSAGVFAAISAARTGVSTVLLERSSMLGGTATNGGVNFPGLFHAYGKQIISGPCWEAIERCDKLGGAKIPKIVERPENHWDLQISIDRNIYNRVLEEMCRESGVRIMYYSTVFAASENTSADSPDGKKGIILAVAGINGVETVFAKKAIDATGDANLAAILGYERIRNDILQPGTIEHNIAGYDPDDQRIDYEKLNSLVEKALQNGELEYNCFRGRTPEFNLRYGKIPNHIFTNDGSDSLSKTDLDLRARASLFSYIDFLRKNPGLENVYASYVAAETGVRETYRIIGSTFMTVDKYCSGYVYPDSVCYGFYPVDLHVAEGIDKRYDLDDGAVPTIPYGALVPTKNGIPSENLLVAGRCISADTYTMSAIRVQAPCMAEGQAAGCAASICARKDLSVSEVCPEAVRVKLSDLGAIVPNLR